MEQTLLNSSGKSDINISIPSGFTHEDINWLKGNASIENISTILQMQSKIDTSVESSQFSHYTVNGIIPTQEMKIRKYDVQEGEMFTDLSDERVALISQKNANLMNLVVGDTIKLQINGKTIEYKISGLLDNTGAGFADVNIPVYIPLKTLQKDAGIDTVNKIDLSVGGDEELITSVSENIRKHFGSQATINNFESNYRVAQNDVQTMKIGFNILSIIIFFISLYFIYNIFLVSVYQRINTIGILKTLGISKQNTFALIMREALIVGVIGTISGIVLGIVLGKTLLVISEDNTIGELMHIPMSSIIMCVAGGILMPVVASMIPALKASRYSPIGALTANESSYYEKGKSKSFWSKFSTIFGFPCLLIAFAISFIMEPLLKDGMAYVIMMVEVIFFTLAIILLLPLIVIISTKILTPIFKLFKGEGVYTCRNIIRNKNRNSIVVATLVIGMIMILGFNGLFNSFRSSAGNFVDRTFKYDLYVEGKLETYGTEAQVVEKLKATESITYTAQVRAENIQDEKSELNCRLFGIVGEDYKQVAGFDIIEGDTNEALNQIDTDPYACVIGSYLSDLYELKIGDYYTFSVSDKEVKLKISAIINSLTQDGRVIYMNKDTLDEIYGNKKISCIYIKVADGTDTAVVKEKLNDVFSNQSTYILSISEIRKDWTDEIVKGTKIFDALNIIVLLIGILLLINTLVMSSFERRREYGLIRSIGARRSSIVKIILLESVAFTSVGIIFGVLGSLAFAYFATNGMAGALNLKVNLDYPIRFAVIVSLIMVISSLIASLYPAITASRQNITEIIKKD